MLFNLKRFAGAGWPMLGVLLLAGCASEPKVVVQAPPMPAVEVPRVSMGERMSRASTRMNSMMQQWEAGRDLIEKGKSQMQRGQAMIDEGRDMIKRGEGLQSEAESFYQGQPGFIPH